VGPATLIALLALCLALGGGAYALAGASPATITACAHRDGGALYLARSCRRGDLKLRWSAAGPSGAPGAGGAAGGAGAGGGPGGNGPTGLAGGWPATLPSDSTLKGAYALEGAAAAGDRPGTVVSFKVPLASAPTTSLVVVGAGATAACPGSTRNPLAAPGNLCIYEAVRQNMFVVSWEDPLTRETGGAVERFGFEMAGFVSAPGAYSDTGSWAVTAP
jgi:hypothetical protein